MNAIQIFESPEFGTIRTMSNEQGEPLFCGKDVAVALGYKKPENAIAVHVEDEDKTSTLIQGSGSNYKSKTTFINESGLYALILSSKLESARRFKHWVTAEVLPAIRKQGGYLLFLYGYLEGAGRQALGVDEVGAGEGLPAVAHAHGALYVLAL